MLLTEMENRPHDKWELHEMILEKLNELRAFGWNWKRNFLLN